MVLINGESEKTRRTVAVYSTYRGNFTHTHTQRKKTNYLYTARPSVDSSTILTS